MLKEKIFYLECLKNGKMKHSTIYNRMRDVYPTSATTIRDILLADGYIEQCGFVTRHDGKKDYLYRLTKKKFSEKEKKQAEESYTWDDGTFKSRGNAFDWRSYARGVFSQSELAATENGRKWGVATASKQILPRVTI
jgi:hypothetical protein